MSDARKECSEQKDDATLSFLLTRRNHTKKTGSSRGQASFAEVIRRRNWNEAAPAVLNSFKPDNASPRNIVKGPYWAVCGRIRAAVLLAA